MNYTSTMFKAETITHVGENSGGIIRNPDYTRYHTIGLQKNIKNVIQTKEIGILCMEKYFYKGTYRLLY